MQESKQTGIKELLDSHKLLVLLVALYMTVFYMTIVLIYKLIYIGPYYVSASTVIIPFWYMISDIIAETYGYNISRQLIWAALLGEFLFIFASYGLIHLHSPAFWQHQDAYNFVLGSLPRVFIGSMSAIVLGAFINVYCITKWKILIKGRFFWLRSLGSSAIGEAVFTVVAFAIEFISRIPAYKILELILLSYIIKLLFLCVCIYPATIVVKYLKQRGCDLYDYNTNFNPFKLATKE